MSTPNDKSPGPQEIPPIEPCPMRLGPCHWRVRTLAVALRLVALGVRQIEGAGKRDLLSRAGARIRLVWNVREQWSVVWARTFRGMSASFRVHDGGPDARDPLAIESVTARWGLTGVPSVLPCYCVPEEARSKNLARAVVRNREAKARSIMMDRHPLTRSPCLGDGAPNFWQLGRCSIHVSPILWSVPALVGPIGAVRWATQSTPGAPMFPLDPALLAQEMGLQAMDLSTLVLSSAARLHVGGGL